jgi:GcrA cell cycle regulator
VSRKLIAWTDAMLDDLKSRWAAGESAKQIAVALNNGVTRNAVISKVHHLSLPKRRQRGVNATMSMSKALKRPTAAKPNVSMIRISKAPAVKAKPLLPEIPAADSCNLVRLEDLEPSHCRWPIGDPQAASFGFCGAPKAEERSYCAHHCAIAYAPQSESKRKKAQFAYVERR